MSEVCGSRIPTKQEDDLGLRTAERIARVGEMISLLTLEIAKCKSALSCISSRSKAAKNQLQATEANRDELEEQLASLESELQDDPSAKVEKIVVERLRKKNNAKMEAAAGEYRIAVSELELVESTLKSKQRQLTAFSNVAQHLKFGGRPSGMQPWPLFYARKIPLVGPVVHLAVTVCSLCAFPFPNFDIIVANCKHLYHPWCALTVFGKGRGTACVERMCQGFVHPNWHTSFGWGIPSEELQQRAIQFNLDGEALRLKHDREKLALQKDEALGKSSISCFVFSKW